MISGPPRIGKTIIGTAIAEKINAEFVGTDRLRADFTNSPTPAFSRVSRYTRLISSAHARGRSIVLEGVDLLKTLTFDSQGLDTLLFFRDEMGCLPAIFGPSLDETEATIAEAITHYSIHHRDYIFTKNRRDKEKIREFAVRRAAEEIRLGDYLRKVCKENLVPYFTIQRSMFEYSARNVTDEIYNWIYRPQ